VPNLIVCALVRAGDLEDRAIVFRNDRVVAGIAGAPKNPHTFLTNIASVPQVWQRWRSPRRGRSPVSSAAAAR